MPVIIIHEAKIHYFKLLERVQNGEEVVITNLWKRVARIVPFAVDDHSPCLTGIDQGKPVRKLALEASPPEFDL